MGLSGNDRAIARFTMAGHATVHWFETAIPIFLVVWLGTFDVTLAVLGLVVAVGYAPFGLGALPAGVLTDRFGPRRLVVVCLLGMSAGFFVLALASSLVLVAAGLFVWGVAASIYHPAGLALISTGVDDRGTVFAWHGIAGNVGLALGPFVAATLLAFLEWQTVAALLAIPGVLAALYGVTLAFDPVAAVDRTETRSIESLSLAGFRATTRTLFASVFALVFVIVTVEGLFYRGAITYLPEVLHGLPAVAALDLPSELEGIEAADYIYVGFLVVGMAGQYVGGKLTNRIRPSAGLSVLFAGLAACALAFVPVTRLGATAVVALSGVLGFLLFAIQPFYQNAVAVFTPPDARGLSYGYTYLGEFGIGAASVAVGGFLLGSVSVAAFFAMLAALGVLGGALSVVLARVSGTTSG